MRSARLVPVRTGDPCCLRAVTGRVTIGWRGAVAGWMDLVTQNTLTQACNIRLPLVFRLMSKTARVTDIYKFGDMYAANIHFRWQEYRVAWHGDWRNFPDIGSFPQVPGTTVTSISHSPEVDELWATSQLLCYGADHHITLLHQAATSGEKKFPFCKVAGNDRQGRLIRDE